MDGRRCEDYTVLNSHDKIIDPFKFPPDKSSFPLRFIQKEMGKFTALSMSLISTDLMWAKFVSPLDETSSFQIPSYILAIAPRTSLSSQLASLGKTWLLCVGECSDRIFHQMMFEFGRAGALRWDFEDNFQLETPTELGLGLGHSTPRLARTIGSLRFPGQPEVVAIQFAEKSESLHRQLTIMARIQMHPNIIGFHGAFHHQDGDQLMLTFQHVPRDLALQIQLLGTLEQSRCLEVMYGILTALNYLHQNSVVHRNIHPRAVCLSRTGKVMLTGFDDAVNIDDHNAMKTVAGTPGYVAPELILRKPYGLKVDIFSVGAIYFTVLTGQQPFWRAGDDDHAVLQRTVEGDIDFERPKFELIPYSLQFLLKSMFQQNPRARPSAADAADDCWGLMSSSQKEKLGEASSSHTGLVLSVQQMEETAALAGSDDEVVSRSSSRSSVFPGASTPLSVLEQEERQPNLEVLEEGTSCQERSSSSGTALEQIGRSASSTPQGSRSRMASSQRLSDDPEHQAEDSPQAQDLGYSADLARDREVCAAPQADHSAVVTPARDVPPESNDTPAASSHDRHEARADDLLHEIPRRGAPDATAASAVPTSSNQVRASSLQGSEATPASSSSASLPWPLRALSQTVQSVRQAGNFARQSLWNRRTGPPSVNAEDLDGLVPQRDSSPQPRRQRSRHRARVQPTDDMHQQ